MNEGNKSAPDIRAPIIPGKSAAGFLLGSRIDDFLIRPELVENRSQFLVHAFPFVKVWAMNGLITQIGVYEGCRGTIDDQIRIGSTIAEVESWCDCQVVEDDEDNLIVTGHPGWCFETNEWIGNHTVEDNRKASIVAIFVFRVP
jgi:hypothetical protein